MITVSAIKVNVRTGGSGNTSLTVTLYMANQIHIRGFYKSNGPKYGPISRFRPILTDDVDHHPRCGRLKRFRLVMPPILALIIAQQLTLASFMQQNEINLNLQL